MSKHLDDLVSSLYSQRDVLKDENARLRAELSREREQLTAVQQELQTLKPKPVVRYSDVQATLAGVLYHGENFEPNLKLTFHDGVLVGAEVLKE